MDNGVLMALAVAASAIVGAAITGLANRLQSRDTTASTMLSTMAKRQTDQEHTIGELQERVGNAIDDVATWQERWSEERELKHDIQSKFQAAVLEYELTIEKLRTAHADEISKMTHDCELTLTHLNGQVRDLEVEVTRLTAMVTKVGGAT